MLILLGAWLFWLALRGRLQTYAAFATTANAAGGFKFPSFSIPVSINAALQSAQSVVAPTSGAGTPTAAAPSAMPGIGQYVNSLPAGDNSVWGNIYSVATGYGPSGLPSYSTLGQLNTQANTNVSAGGPY